MTAPRRRWGSPTDPEASQLHEPDQLTSGQMPAVGQHPQGRAGEILGRPADVLVRATPQRPAEEPAAVPRARGCGGKHPALDRILIERPREHLGQRAVIVDIDRPDAHRDRIVARDSSRSMALRPCASLCAVAHAASPSRARRSRCGSALLVGRKPGVCRPRLASGSVRGVAACGSSSRHARRRSHRHRGSGGRDRAGGCRHGRRGARWSDAPSTGRSEPAIRRSTKLAEMQTSIETIQVLGGYRYMRISRSSATTERPR